MSTAFTEINRGSDLQSTRFRTGFGFMVDPGGDGSGTNVRIYQGWDGRGVGSPILVESADFVIADGDFVYVHEMGGGGGPV